MKSFSQYLIEANYGALQKDNRISQLRDYLLSLLKKSWIENKDTSVIIKDDYYPLKIHVELHIKKVTSGEDKKELLFVGGAHATNGIKNIIVIKINSDVDVQEAIHRIEEIKPLLSHEIKHLLDDKDKHFKKPWNDHYKDLDDVEVTYKEYVTQIREINNFLITVLEDLGNIKYNNKNISFDDALKKSFWWNRIYNEALYDYKKLNKFKSKLANYWNKDLTKIHTDNTKTLRLQLMLLLYQWHKEGDIKKVKDSGKSVKSILQSNVERMSVEQLESNIAKFRNLLQNRKSQ